MRPQSLGTNHLDQYSLCLIQIYNTFSTKLALTTFSMELASKWSPDVTVHDMCPGPVASSIASHVPVLGPIVTGILGALFPTRFEAALPVLRLVSGGVSGW